MRRSPPIHLLLTIISLAAILWPVLSSAHDAGRSDNPWTFRTGVVAAGSSEDPDSGGYKVYSGFSIEAAISRRIGWAFGVEFAARTESREVDIYRGLNERGSTEYDRLGSVEIIPLNLILQFRPAPAHRVQPYIGAGANLTICWEKSGALDSTDLSPSVAPIIQLGTDLELSPDVLLSLDYRWNRWRTNIDEGGRRIATVKIDPASFGLGLGFRF